MITTDSGEQVEALAPIIISASRSTDIPAFYAKWFFNRLAKGYCVWYNPFNRRKMYVSFERCKAIVFWTKNPKLILPYLHELDRRGIHYYFQFTLNDYVSEGFEPNVPSVTQRVETFRELSEMIGKERVIWRFDPLIMTPSIQLMQIRQYQLRVLCPKHDCLTPLKRHIHLPAFYAKWFFNRLAKGYCVWYNPFNRLAEMMMGASASTCSPESVVIILPYYYVIRFYIHF